ncbi:MAG: 2-amino-4-hydroxy-6-hydroxymethyldihydropteridine diphosphokinase [Alphaproteobacteria bacterium]|nr:2-amino-4-hydroxy-6-hydroxymethyldihydropteridine diphosphokinase [Alphaproteobacteria bacterium]
MPPPAWHEVSFWQFLGGVSNGFCGFFFGDFRVILVGIGSNLRDLRGRAPREIVPAAVASFGLYSVELRAMSRLWSSAPVLPGGEGGDDGAEKGDKNGAVVHGRYINAVAEVGWEGDAWQLLSALHRIERDFGRDRSRERGQRPSPRTLDLDLLDFRGEIIDDNRGLTLPHPEILRRGFVLRPLAEIAPDWRHPVSGAGVLESLAALPAGGAAADLHLLDDLG